MRLWGFYAVDVADRFVFPSLNSAKLFFIMGVLWPTFSGRGTDLGQSSFFCSPIFGNRWNERKRSICRSMKSPNCLTSRLSEARISLANEVHRHFIFYRAFLSRLHRFNNSLVRSDSCLGGLTRRNGKSVFRVRTKWSNEPRLLYLARSSPCLDDVLTGIKAVALR